MNRPEPGFLNEIFISHQGEGPWLGRRQLFIRLAGCSQKCHFCDTPQARQPEPGYWRLCDSPDGSSFRRHQNPVAVPRLMALIRPLLSAQGPVHSVALTGGEPLEQPGFVCTLGRSLKKNFKKVKILLETNGLCSTLNKKDSSVFDFISLDFKLKSASGLKTPWRLYPSVLGRFAQKQGCIKAVVIPATTRSEITTAARLALRAKPAWAFILQPAFGHAWQRPALARRLDALSRAALAVHPHTYLIPQMHRLLGLS